MVPFLSTLPARGATRVVRVFQDNGKISIHAPREGSDRYTEQYKEQLEISIHAPREGSDPSGPEKPPVHRLFLSTLPARGATAAVAS